MLDKKDPRVPGGQYLSGYWHQQYEVIAMWSSLRWRQVWMTVRWSDGHTTTHCTAWDRSDKVLREP